MVSVKLAASKTKEFKEFSDEIGKQLLALSPQIAGIFKSFQDKTKAIDLDIEFEHIYNLHQFLSGAPIFPRELNKIREMLQIDAPLIQTVQPVKQSARVILYDGAWLKSRYTSYRARFAAFAQEIACAYGLIYPKYNIHVLFSMLSYFESLHFKYTVDKSPDPVPGIVNTPDDLLFRDTIENVFANSNDGFYLYHDSANCNNFIFDEMHAGGELIYDGDRPWIYSAKIEK